MLTLEQLKGMVTQGEIETVVAGFTDHYGRLMGKRFDAEMFVDEVAEDGGHACDYLLTVDMEMEPVPGLQVRQLGARLRRRPPGRPTWPRCASRAGSTRPRSCSATCKSEKTHDLRRGRAALDPARGRSMRRSKLGFTGYAATELEHYLFTHQLPRGRAAGLPQPRARRLVPRGLPHAAGHAHRGLPRARRAAT